MAEPTSRQKYEIAKIVADTPEERFFEYIKFSWEIFKSATEKINQEALTKDSCTAKYSEISGKVTNAAVLAGGVIANFFLPGIGAAIKVASKVIHKAVSATGAKIEISNAHSLAKNLQNIVGSFDSKNPKSYIPVTDAFADIFISYNLQMIYLLDPKCLDFHLSKALFKFAVDTVSKIFNGFEQLLNEKEKNLPIFFSKEFVIKCFLSGKPQQGIFDEIRLKLPKKFFGKSHGGHHLSKGRMQMAVEFHGVSKEIQ